VNTTNLAFWSATLNPSFWN